MNEEQEQECKKIKAILDAVKKDDRYKVISLYNSEKYLSLDKETGFVWIIDTYKGYYSMDLLTKEVVDTIIELVK